MTDARIEIDLDKACTRCGSFGSTPRGLCLECIGKQLEEPLTTDTVDKPIHPILRTQVRLLPVKLTDDELRRLGGDLATVCQDIGAETDRADSVKRELKARMTGLESRRTQLATMIRRGDEMRDVEVVTHANYERAVAIEIRTDTGEVLLERVLSEKERQLDLRGLQPGVPLDITRDGGPKTTVTLEPPADEAAPEA